MWNGRSKNIKNNSTPPNNTKSYLIDVPNNNLEYGKHNIKHNLHLNTTNSNKSSKNTSNINNNNGNNYKLKNQTRTISIDMEIHLQNKCVST